MKILVSIALIFLSVACSKQEKSSEVLKVDKYFNLEASVETLDFGLIGYKQSDIQTIKIVNNSSTTSEIVNPIIHETNSSYFSIVYKNNCDKALAPEESCIIKVSFNNTSPVISNFSAELTAGNLLIYLLATGNEEVPQLSFESNNQVITSTDFGIVSNKYAMKHVSLSNRSKINETIGTLSLDNAHFDLLFNNCENQVLEPQKSCKIILGFDARGKSDQAYTGNLSVNNKVLALNSQVLGGVVSNPSYEVVFLEGANTVSSTDFGNVWVPKSKTIAIKNVGNSLIPNVTPQFDNNNFSLDYSSCSGPLAPERSCIVKLTYHPHKMLSGTFSTNLSVATNQSLSILAEKRPIINSASLTGPTQRHDGIMYYTKHNLGVEILPQVSAEFLGENLTYKYSLNNDCSGSLELSGFNLNANQPNNVFVQVEDSRGVKSNCHALGSLVHDDIAPAIGFIQTELLELNETSLSANYLYDYTISDTNKKNDHKVQVANSNNCSDLQGEENLTIEEKEIALNIREYKSLQVQAEDKAGNLTSQCSFPITYGQVHQVVMSGSSSEDLDALNNKTTNVSLKDIHGNNLVNMEIEVSSANETKTFSTGSSGVVEIEYSSKPDYTGPGFKLLLPNGSFNHYLNVSHLPSNKTNSKSIYVKRRSCSELLHYDGVSGDGKYFLDFDGVGPSEPLEVYCDMAGGGWMRLDDSLNYQSGKNCVNGYGEVDPDGSWHLQAKPQSNSVNTSKGACGISLADNILMEQIKIENASLNTNGVCSAANYPEPQIQVVSGESVADYTQNANELSGYDFAAQSGTPSVVFSKNLSGGLANGIYNFAEGSYKLHFGAKAEERMSVTTVNHNNANVTNKLMFTLLDDMILGESSILYVMTTGWISHTSSMVLRNAAGTAIWSGGRSRSNGSFSTVDEYPVNLTSAGKNSYFQLTSSASVWNNTNGNHASDRLEINVKYNTCVQKPVSAKLWAKTGAYLYPKSCFHALNRNPSLANTGTNVATIIDTDGYDGANTPMNVSCDFNNGGWTVVPLTESTYVNSGNASGVYYMSSSLRAQSSGAISSERRESYMRYSGSIPEFTTAQLHLYCFGGDAAGAELTTGAFWIRRLLNNWGSSTSYNTRPSFEASNLAAVNASGMSKWYIFDMSTYFQNLKNNAYGNNFGFGLAPSSIADDFIFYSSTSGTNPAFIRFK